MTDEQPTPPPFAPPTSQPYAPLPAFDPTSASPPPPPTGTNGFAIAAFCLGLVGAIPLAVIFGIIALVQVRESRQKGRGFAVTGLVLSGLWVLIIALVVIVGLAGEADRDSDGDIVSSGKVEVTELEVGDCVADVNDFAEDELVLTLDAVPCAEQHGAEVYAIVTLDDTAYPGDDEVSALSEERCVDELETASPEAFEDETYAVIWFQPTEDSWSEDDRDLSCLVSTESPTTGSVLD